TRTSQCSLSTKSSDSTSAFEHFETVMFTVPVVDLGKQSILYLGPSARSLDFEACPNFVHTWLKPFTISPGAHDLLVGLARPFTANNFGDSCGFIGFGTIVIEVRRGCRDGDCSILLEEWVIEVVRNCVS